MSQKLDDRIAVIVWHPVADRPRGYAEALNAPIYYVYRGFFRPRILAPFRYVLQAYDTWAIILRKRPRIVHVTNPPVIAALAVWACCLMTGARYVMDTHPPALYSPLWGWTVPLQHLAARLALLNIVDQVRFKRLFEMWGAKAIVLENVPKRRSLDSFTLNPPGPGAPLDITVVNTFSIDEPLDPILEAAAELPDARFFILGDTRYLPRAVLARKPGNVVFTGFLRGDDYWKRLASSNAIMCLTTYPYSLLAGGHDAMLLGVPLITSRQPVLTEYFIHGTLFVDNSAAEIVRAVNAVRNGEPVLRREMADLRLEKQKAWKSNFEAFRDIIEEAMCPRR